ncbi:unnamed protein product [Closterium sp. NIES-65]|nr:unnamed protein product [Closterium sp. NIES-65]
MPLDQGRFPLEWEEWPRGEDTVVKLPDDPSARFVKGGCEKRCKGSKGRASWDGKEGEVFASAKGHELWRRAAIPRFCEDMQDDYGPSDGASGSSSRSDSSGRNRRNQGRIEDDGTGKEGEEAAYLKAWPGGVNLVACLREMLLGEPCYCPVSPAAPSTSAAPTTPAAPSTPASSSTPAAPLISVVPNHAKPAPALGTEYTGTAVGGERKVASGGELNAIEGEGLQWRTEHFYRRRGCSPL